MLAAIQATEWQSGTVVWIRHGRLWKKPITWRGGWQGLRRMQCSFCAGVALTLGTVAALQPAAPADVVLQVVGYQADLTFVGGVQQQLTA